MATSELPISKSGASKSDSKAKGKGNAESLTNSGKTVMSSSKGTGTTSTSSGTNEAHEEEETEWPWTTLAESCVGSRPVVFTTDGNYFFSIIGAAVRIYSVATGRVVSTLSSSSTGSSASLVATGEGHSDVITAAILNPENPFQLVTASLDGSIKVWNFLDAVLLRTIHVGNPISHMCAHDKFKGQVFIAVSTKAKKITGTSSVDKGNTMVYRIALTPKQSDSSKSSEIVRIGKTRAPVSMGVSASGSWLVVVAGYKAYVSSTSSPESGFTKFVSPEKLTCLAFHSVDEYFATGDEIGQIRLWYCLNSQLTFNTASGGKRAQTTTMHWHAHAVSSLAFTRNGAYLLSGGEESVLVIWQLQTGKREFLPRLGSSITTITVREASENEEEYLLGLADGSYTFINPGSLTVTRSISRIRLDPKGMGRAPHSPVPLAVHPKTSSLILPASHPSSLQIYSPSTSALSELEVSSSNRISRRDEKEIESARVDFVSVSASGEWMATIDTRDNEEEFSVEVNLKIWQWNSSTWELNTRIDCPHGPKRVVAMGFSPICEEKDDELLMTAGLDGNVKTWCIRNVAVKGGIAEAFWTSRSILSFRSKTPSDACWSPDGSILAVCFGRQITLYDLYSSLLLDCFAVLDAYDISCIRFVGRSGRYILATGRNDAILWDLVSRRVCWRYHSTAAIAQALAHPLEDLVTLIVQPFVENSALRTSKILRFRPTSSSPFELRCLPFRFRGVDWNGLDKTGNSLIGFTYAWNIVICGSDVRASSGFEEAPREIDAAAGVLPKKTLFQDIFGKSAFADVSANVTDDLRVTSQSVHITRDGHEILSVFDVPTYLAPPIETTYTALMEGFLERQPERQLEESHAAEEHEDADDMVIDSEPPHNIRQERTVESAEVDSLIELFRRQSVNGALRRSNQNGIVNGVHKSHVNGVGNDYQPRIPPPKVPRASATKDDMSRNKDTSNVSPEPSAPVAVGKKRKKSTS